ncbi:MAG: hypothetical protein KGZ79_16565 [Dethiobacter sp.]|jgi:hypothetical protein|nr:hypothetical protein [Dethiobacter sp.]
MKLKFKSEYLFCSPRLLKNVYEVNEIYECVQWQPHFTINVNGTTYEHQTAYNKAFELQFSNYNWSRQPMLIDNPRLIGDYQKNDVFVEIQFGNSATLYRDYYKFHFGLTHGLLSLAVLIVPTKPTEFFPTRPKEC